MAYLWLFLFLTERFILKKRKHINSMSFITSMTTTISISEELREKLKNLGRAGDSYEDVIGRMYELTRKQLLLSYLYDDSDSVSIDDAIKEARKKWQK
jgi:predicted CopG family antitoxin